MQYLASLSAGRSDTEGFYSGSGLLLFPWVDSYLVYKAVCESVCEQLERRFTYIYNTDSHLVYKANTM